MFEMISWQIFVFMLYFDFRKFHETVTILKKLVIQARNFSMSRSLASHISLMTMTQLVSWQALSQNREYPPTSFT